MAKSFTGAEFLKALTEDAMRNPIRKEGMVKKDENDPQVILFAEGSECLNWTKVPIGLIEKIDLLTTVRCRDHEHPFVALYLKEAPTDNKVASVLAELLRNSPTGAPERPNPPQQQSTIERRRGRRHGHSTGPGFRCPDGSVPQHPHLVEPCTHREDGTFTDLWQPACGDAIYRDCTVPPPANRTLVTTGTMRLNDTSWFDPDTIVLNLPGTLAVNEYDRCVGHFTGIKGHARAEIDIRAYATTDGFVHVKFFIDTYYDGDREGSRQRSFDIAPGGNWHDLELVENDDDDHDDGGAIVSMTFINNP